MIPVEPQDSSSKCLHSGLYIHEVIALLTYIQMGWMYIGTSGLLFHLVSLLVYCYTWAAETELSLTADSLFQSGCVSVLVSLSFLWLLIVIPVHANIRPITLDFGIFRKEYPAE